MVLLGVKGLRIFVERNLSGIEFHTLAPIKVVDFRPKFVVFLRGTTSLLVPLKPFTLLRTTNKSLIYPDNIPLTALKINMAMSCGDDWTKLSRSHYHHEGAPVCCRHTLELSQ